MSTTEETHSAEPVLDATEPAPSIDETQAIYAWSQSEDETPVTRRHSWMLPVVLAILAAIAVTAGVVMLWPASKPASPAAQTTTSPDVQFIDMLNSGLKNEPGFQGAKQGDPDAIATGHLVCEKLSNLYPVYGPPSRERVIQWLITEGGAPSKSIATTVESSAERAYCPQYH